MIRYNLGFSPQLLAGLWKTMAQHDLAYRDAKTDVVWVRRMLFYQGKGEKNARAAARQLETLHNCSLIERFLEAYPECVPFYKIRHPIPYPECAVGTGTVTEAGTVTGTVAEEIGALRPLPLEVESEGSKAEKEKAVEVPNAKAKPGPEILFEIFDQENKQLPQVKARSRERMAKCRSRINQAASSGCLEQYLKDFRAAVSKAQSTPFLCGDNERGWRADFDWFVANHTNPYRVLEGKYDSTKKGGNANGATEGSARPAERNPFSSGPRYDPKKLHPET
jgi:hypothetical protein